MKWIATRLTALGDFFMGLTDRQRNALVLATLLVLGVGASYKLIVSIGRLNDPAPAPSPAQLMGPMEQLFRDTQRNVGTYQQHRQQETRRLDSLARAYQNYKP